jgi:hypothetical protein
VPRIRVSILIDAPPRVVWEAVRDIATHPTWMKDAVAIRFTSAHHEGVGTTFDCDTRVGPFAMTDRMEVTEWREGEVMGIRHVGMVTGTGRFTLHPAPPDATRFEWTEELEFPHRAGGRVGGLVARPVLRRVWRGNLRRLKQQIEALPRQ